MIWLQSESKLHDSLEVSHVVDICKSLALRKDAVLYFAVFQVDSVFVVGRFWLVFLCSKKIPREEIGWT